MTEREQAYRSKGDDMPKAYTYLIVRKADRKRYIGARWANRLDPKDDLGVEYFTSSDVVRPEFERDPSAFMFRVLREFECSHEARTVEFELIRDIGAVKSPQYLNLGNYGVGSIEMDGTPRPVVGVRSDGDAIEYPSVSAAIKAHGRNVSNALLGTSKTAYERVWQFQADRQPIDPSAYVNDKKRPVLAWKDGEIVGLYESATNAAHELGSGRPFGIFDAAAGRIKSSLGFQWTYLDRGEDSRLNSESIDTLPLEDAAGEVDPGPEEAMLAEEWLDSRRQALVSAKAAMTAKQREAFELIREQGKTWEEARLTLGLSTNSSMAERLAGADRKIKAALAATEE